MKHHPSVLIVGAGVSGLLLAQRLRHAGVPFRIFERDADLTTRGLGWGLTLHWSLPALRSLLPDDLVRRLPEAYVDRAAVELARRASTFPLFDLATGKLVASTPAAPESQRIRIARDRFRRLLATGIDIEWGKNATEIDDSSGQDEAVTVRFEDGSSCSGTLLAACDGGNSRIRRLMHPRLERQPIPVRVMGVRLELTPAQVEPLRMLDPFFLQGTSSQNDTYVYFSILDAPGNNDSKVASGGRDVEESYTCQMVFSWPARDGFFGQPAGVPFPATNDGRLELIRAFAATWADPFRALALSIPAGTEVKPLKLFDFPPPAGFRGAGRVALVGDALHAMAMYRGEGANHAIVDVADLVDLVIAPHVQAGNSSLSELRAALDAYEDKVVDRARPGVLASRQACLDAHEWARIGPQSPLLSRRVMKVEYDESTHILTGI